MLVSNEELTAKLSDDQITIVDVREPAEYAFSHLPNAISLPLGELDGRLSELDNDKQIYVVCRTGTRSDLAAQKLAENGYNVINVVPGMSQWEGPTTSDI